MSFDDSVRGHGDSEMAQRLREKGAQYGEITISLMWNSLDDLDLHVFTPSKERIFYRHRTSKCGGRLDVDMNASYPYSITPCENIVWPFGAARDGKYGVYVNNFSNRTGQSHVPFTVHISLYGGKAKVFQGMWKRGDRLVHVNTFEFDSTSPEANSNISDTVLRAKDGRLLFTVTSPLVCTASTLSRPHTSTCDIVTTDVFFAT